MSLLATSSADLKFHRWRDGNIQNTYIPPNRNTGCIKSVSWSKDGLWVVIVPSAGAAEVLSIRDNLKLLHTVYDVQLPSCAVFQNSTKKNIAIGTTTGQVLVYDVKARSIRKRFPRTSSAIFELQYNANDSHLAAACRNGEILLYDNVTINIATFYKVPDSEMVSTLSFHSQCKNMLTAGSTDGVVAVWDINTNQVTLNANAHLAAVSSVAFSPNRTDLLISAGMDRRFLFMDVLQKKTILEFEVQSSVTALDFSPCGTYVATGSQLGDVTVYDTRQLSKPYSHFVSHENKKIYHVLFQKCLTEAEDDASQFNNSVDKSNLSLVNDISEAEPVWRMTEDDTSVKKDVIGQNLIPEEDDSFLAAFGFESCSSSTQQTRAESALGVSEGIERWIDVSKSFFCKPPQVSPVMKSEHRRERKGATSGLNASHLKPITPTVRYVKVQDVPGDNNFSPIPEQLNSQPEGMSQAMRSILKNEFKQLKEEMRYIVKEEVENRLNEEIKQQFAELKKELHFQYLDVIADCRSQINNLHVFIVKEFANLDILIRQTDGITVEDFVGSELLLHEIARLRCEMAKLKEKHVEKD